MRSLEIPPGTALGVLGGHKRSIILRAGAAGRSSYRVGEKVDLIARRRDGEATIVKTVLLTRATPVILRRCDITPALAVMEGYGVKPDSAVMKMTAAIEETGGFPVRGTHYCWSDTTCPGRNSAPLKGHNHRQAEQSIKTTFTGTSLAGQSGFGETRG